MSNTKGWLVISLLAWTFVLICVGNTVGALGCSAAANFLLVLATRPKL